MASSPLVGWYVKEKRRKKETSSRIKSTAANPRLGNRQEGDTTRPTSSIIKTCIVTIFACTWTIQHLTVPAANDGERRRLLRVCKWMLVTILLPEFILAKAIMELALAARCMDEMEKVARHTSSSRQEIMLEYPVLWKLRRWWSAIRSKLGGKKRPDEEQNQGLDGDGGEENPSIKYIWTLTHAYFANMGGFVYNPPGERLLAPGPDHPLTGIQFAKFIHFFDLPSITEDEIKDKSKTDVVRLNPCSLFPFQAVSGAMFLRLQLLLPNDSR
jgi:hypothetical protein